MQMGWCANLQEYLSSGHQKITQQLNSCTSPKKELHVIEGRVVVRLSLGRSGPGKSASLQLYSSTIIDPKSGKGKLSEEAQLKDGKKRKHKNTTTITYKIKFHVEPDFGNPGAFLITNHHKHHHFFLISMTLQISSNHNTHFNCNSWVYPIRKTSLSRVFFSNKSYLPGSTPEALVGLRTEEMISLRGDGRGERKEWDRIYDYDYYNDLANPDKDRQYARPVLGGTRTFPYPRRGRTGRARSSQDPRTESRPEIINLDVYVPPDERFTAKKLSDLVSHALKAVLHFVIPEAKSLFQDDSKNFQTLNQVYEMFSGHRSEVIEGSLREKLKKLMPEHLIEEMSRSSKQNTIKFPLPQIIAGNDMAWREDEEFGREMVAGINPVVIECLRTFPPKSKTGKSSSIKAFHVEKSLEGLTIEQAMSESRIFILDHHEYLMPYLNRINTQGVCVYASRTLLFLSSDGKFMPVAIELSLPSLADTKTKEISRVFVPAKEGSEAALWKLAKAHVAANDSGYHQLISHWLRTHAVVEPFVIATRRQLSVIHPIHKLLDPHFKDTMHINALARTILINAGGVLEKTMFPGRFSMEMSSALYKDWRFDEQGLPADLLKRRMALEAPEEPSGVRLLYEDYPYAVDGLEIWMAIKTWVMDYCSLYYPTDDTVVSDIEIQSWWTEIRLVGHGDKSEEKWWHPLSTISELTQTLTTLIWISSALHASLNFGQYGYAGFPPNRPTFCRRFIPEEGTTEFAEFLRDPDEYYLKMIPDRFTATLAVAVAEILSTHMSDEVYLGQRLASEWMDDEEVRRRFDEFKGNLLDIEKRILERNVDPKLKNRWGPAQIPYTLMFPETSSERSYGITGKGIPNSISA